MHIHSRTDRITPWLFFCFSLTLLMALGYHALLQLATYLCYLAYGEVCISLNFGVL